MAGVRVDLKDRSYDIHIAPGLLSRLGELTARLGLRGPALLVADKTVGGLYGAAATAALAGAGLEARLVCVEPGEQAKSLACAGELYTQAIEAGLDRKSPVIALGGGVVGDLAGFVAATYLRGVPFIQVPTTLLAQVDSSVGGKVAVNHPLGKNLIGAFYQPRLVALDPRTLDTLPDREFTAGLAEVVKYGMIADQDFFEFLKRGQAALRRRQPEVLADVIERCCAIKAGIVREDETDTGIRMTLNFGHTIGHAVEACAGFGGYRHGEAVAVGMYGAALLSRRLGLCPAAVVEELGALLRGLGLPVTAAGCRPEALMELLARDKKKLDSALNWVLTPGPGRAVIRADVPEEAVRGVLADIT